jgi:hypothetical protein
MVDILMTLGNIAETITVAGESPMIETNRLTSVINIEASCRGPRRHVAALSSDASTSPGRFAERGDGVGAGPVFRGSHIYAHAFQLEGTPASAYIDSAAHSMGMGGDTVQDVEIKLGGADASTPLSTGVVMNVVTPSGSNEFTVGDDSFQPTEWNGDNTKGALPRRTPTAQSVNQLTCQRAAESSATGCGSSAAIATPTCRTASADADRPLLPDGLRSPTSRLRQQLEGKQPSSS